VRVRLLDQVAQCQAPFLVQQDSGRIWRLTSACDFSQRVRDCPLRYVLADDLTRTCTAIAYSDGDRVADCLDLLRVPAEQLWVEWSDGPRREEILRALPECRSPGPEPGALRVGSLINAARSGRSGVIRTFWNTQERPDDPLVAALETHFDFDAGEAEPGTIHRLLQGQSITIPAGTGDGLDEVLRCARFRYDEAWLEYYRATAHLPEVGDALLRASLSTVAFDLPVLLALFLLFATRTRLPQTQPDLARLNAKRHRSAKQPLLEYIEASEPIFADAGFPTASSGAFRQGPRFHHVRGHLVRRGDAVFWRAPHWRGHLRLGRVSSRTVTLRDAVAG
jgi:hypothetical protein